tara:strand:- start:13626 stop:13835 length:210 start_codon:yes stop_codon:yes gene_type:complete
MRKKTIQWVSENLSDPQLVRVADLVMRRMIDAGVKNYDEEDQKIFQKMSTIKERATRHDLRLALAINFR